MHSGKLAHNADDRAGIRIIQHMPGNMLIYGIIKEIITYLLPGLRAASCGSEVAVSLVGVVTTPTQGYHHRIMHYMYIMW